MTSSPHNTKEDVYHYTWLIKWTKKKTTARHESYYKARQVLRRRIHRLNCKNSKTWQINKARARLTTPKRRNQQKQISNAINRQPNGRGSKIYISDNKQIPGEFFFSKTDLKDTHSQTSLHPSIQKRCNFGKSAGTYRFINGFYGLSDMPATFEKTIEKTLENIPNKFNFLVDILIITRGTLSDHKSYIKFILKRLDEENLAIKLEKCEFAWLNISWLGYNITQSGISPNNKKTDSIKNLEPPKTLKQLRSLKGSVNHQLIKFIPNLASLLDPIRPLPKNENIINNKIKWSDEHTDALTSIKNQITKIRRRKHFYKEKPIRVKSDASHKGLGATLEKWDSNSWFPIAYASRFLNPAEQKYSTNELESLAVVWAIEHFRYYLYGSEFTIATDHQALLSALKSNRGNKSNYSRLTRWVDGLCNLHSKYNIYWVPKWVSPIIWAINTPPRPT